MVLLACALIATAAVAPMAGGATDPAAAPTAGAAVANGSSVQTAPAQPMVAQPLFGPAAATANAAAPVAAGPAADAVTAPAGASVAAPAVATAPGADAAASTPVAAPQADFAPIQPPHDPWEKTNRGIFAFDTAVDRHALGPVAHAYAAVMPRVVRHHITLVIANMDEPVTTANQLFQLHFDKFGRSLARFTFNSTIGLGGIFDFASHHGLPHEGADFGQTLGRWGVKSGPYVVLPLLGPSSVRDSFGRAVDLVSDPVSWVFGNFLTTFGASREAGEVVNGRVQADQALKAVYDSTDPYAAARSGYMQAREADVRAATGKAEVLPDFGEP